MKNTFSIDLLCQSEIIRKVENATGKTIQKVVPQNFISHPCPVFVTDSGQKLQSEYDSYWKELTINY